MPQKRKPARLWENKPRNVWWIVYYDENGKRQSESTGCRLSDREGAEKSFADFLARKTRPSRDSGRDPTEISIAEILNIYQIDRGWKMKRPKDLSYRIEALLGFFKDKPVTAINRRLCREYAADRKKQAARRELEDLRAALRHAFNEEILENEVHSRIELPAKAPPRERWLTRSEAARLIRAAWRYRETVDFRAERKTRQHIARFILVALYTGTRSKAVCGAAMMPTIGSGRGYVDLEQGVFYRREPGTAESNKRQPHVRLPPRLLAHLRRWKHRGISTKAVIEWNGEPVLSVYAAFKRCVADAGLDDKVSPHTLRHTAISWALQNGAEIWQASKFFGVSPEVLTKTYGHHCPQQQKAVAEAITRHTRA